MSLVSLTSCQRPPQPPQPDRSGLKFAVDAHFFKLLEKVDLNRLVKNKSLVPEEGITFQSTSFPSYMLYLKNLTVAEIKNPSVDVTPKNTNGYDHLGIMVRNLEVDLLADFDLRVISVFSDSGKAVPIKIHLNSLDADFYFNQGMVYFDKFIPDIGEIDLEFSSTFFNIIYKIFKPLIIRGINKAVGNINESVQKQLNQFILSEELLDVGFGIGINATNVDRPTLTVVEKEKKSDEVLPMMNFLEDNDVATQIQTAIIKFGVHGSIYPNVVKVAADVPPAINMRYLGYSLENIASVLVSDYTVNTMLFMVQQFNVIKKTVTNTTNDIFPFNIDTDGLSTFVPQFKKRFNTTRPAIIKGYVHVDDNKQPMFTASDEGAEIKINFMTEFNIKETDDFFDDPVTNLKFNVTAAVKVQFVVTDEKLNIVVLSTKVQSVEKLVDLLNIYEDNIQAIQTVFENSLKKYIAEFNDDLTNIDVLGKMGNLTGLEYQNLIFDSEDNYFAFSVDVKNIK